MKSPSDNDYLKHLDAIAQEDAAGLKKAQESYGNSWKKRGGVGAFMMLARKWDRLENALAPGDGSAGSPTHQAKICHHTDTMPSVPAWNILAAAEADQRSEGIIDDIRDLRRYLMLVEAEIRARGINPGHRDNADAGRTVEDCKMKFDNPNFVGNLGPGPRDGTTGIGTPYPHMREGGC